MDLKNVYNKIEEEDISVFSFGIEGVKAVTIEADNKYGVFINRKEILNSDDEFCVLAHEYGHCVSGATHNTHSSFDLVCKHEYRADRRAVLEFLPVEQIKKAIKNGSQNLYEIADYLDMPEQFVEKAIRHYTCMGMI